MTGYLFAGGGTAGHVNPLLAVADRSSINAIPLRRSWSSARGRVSRRLVPDRGYELLTIDRLPFPRRPGRAALAFPGVSPRCPADEEIPDGATRRRCGGFRWIRCRSRLPCGESARLTARDSPGQLGPASQTDRCALHEPGWHRVSKTRIRHGVVVGMPLRSEIERLDRAALRAEAARFFGLDPARPTPLVTGGSTGARSINRAVFDASDSIVGVGWQVLHIAGNGSELPESPSAAYHILNYCDRMDLALAAADLAVSRAGSATVFEFAAVGLPANFSFRTRSGTASSDSTRSTPCAPAVRSWWMTSSPRPGSPQHWCRFARWRSNRAYVHRDRHRGGRDGADRMTDLVVGAAAAKSTR